MVSIVSPMLQICPVPPKVSLAALDVKTFSGRLTLTSSELPARWGLPAFMSLNGECCLRSTGVRLRSGCLGQCKDRGTELPFGSSVMRDCSARCRMHDDKASDSLGHEDQATQTSILGENKGEGLVKNRESSRKKMQRNEWEERACPGRRRMLCMAIPLGAFVLNGLGAGTAAAASGDVFGFDGLGHGESDYVPGRVVALAQAGDGAVLFVGVDGYDLPMRMVVGAAEAMSVLTAAQERRTSRPVTHEAWGSTLAAIGWKVDRVAITSIESEIFFSRVVLSPEDGAKPARTIPASQTSQRSVDMRPSDAIALALRCHAPLFIARDVAEEIVGRVLQGDPDVLGEHKANPEARLDSRGLTAKVASSTAIGTIALHL